MRKRQNGTGVQVAFRVGVKSCIGIGVKPFAGLAWLQRTRRFLFARERLARVKWGRRSSTPSHSFFCVSMIYFVRSSAGFSKFGRGF